ncbi:MAG: hypothetical protein A2845_04450 [Candidatus Lloydbacteria bacterium RIFCSPHIGHO2_01_FULL_49_22]|uniref:Sulfurtransferase n=1 Tax=Candidatus Lloydbacteria bacterium RIFCSPHIGHO2_01_FULL_49_22 TaxID=1798658 RepID=A0A1G2CUC4_9BACT|nr:MAG: hypothetical protein A2845_04450 [Candidatus Lloydbacteria bacterium RIFCSPHIGHO2_01_FULL_49_22]OGZ08901.1 MAG: hypothetical protein A3C14_01485 [Candidatus Lloydbacteria bacterium RIFCSPHIGHO2_02_FULL_50_18]
MNIFRLETSHWYVTRVVYLLAGLFVLVSVGLAVYFRELWWLAVTALIGCMQIIFAMTGYCPSAILLQKLGVPTK